jgi:hypothetical protein
VFHWAPDLAGKEHGATLRFLLGAGCNAVEAGIVEALEDLEARRAPRPSRAPRGDVPELAFPAPGLPAPAALRRPSLVPPPPPRAPPPVPGPARTQAALDPAAIASGIGSIRDAWRGPPRSA